MRIYLSIIQAALVIFLACFGAEAQKGGNFEGTIEMNMDLKGMNADALKGMLPDKITYKLKGNKARVRMLNSSITDLLVLPDKKQAYSINHDEKTAMQFDSKMFDVNLKSKIDKKSLPKITATTETETIAGYKCKKYIMEITEPSTGMKLMSSVWAAKDLKAEMPDIKGVNLLNAKGVDGFPMKIEMNVLLYSLEMAVVSVKKEKIPASEFTLPESYLVKPFNAKEAGLKNPLETTPGNEKKSKSE